MNAASRFLARLIIYSAYSVLTALTVTLLISNVGWIIALGLLLAFFLIDRLWHIGEAEESLTDLKGNEDSVNIADYLTLQSLNLLEKSMDQSLISGNDFYLCLLRMLIKQKDVETALSKIDLDPMELSSKVEDLLKEVVGNSKKITRRDIKDQIESLGKEAFPLAAQLKERFIQPRALFSALAYDGNAKTKRLFNLFAVNPKDLESALIFARFHSRWGWSRSKPKTLGGFAHHPLRIRHRIMNRAWTAKPTPTLDRYGSDITDLAREGVAGFLIGHEKEYSQILDVLARPTKPNVLLVGEPGIGKEAMVNHLAAQIMKDDVPAALFDKRLVSLDLSRLTAGASAEELSQRINKIMGEMNRAGNIVLYIPDIHNLVKTSGEEKMNAADTLVPLLLGDALPVIGATYPKEFKQFIENQSAFASAFEIIRVQEITENDAIKLLTYDGILLEDLYDITITFGAIKEAVRISHKYFHQKPLPSSAEDLLREAVNYCNQKGEKTLKSEDVVAVAERRSNIPIHKAGKEEAKTLLNLENIIHERLVDQEEAVKSVSAALREYRSGLARAAGPIAVFLFVGPTGVGKTELAKILTTIQFGAEKMMIRLDMSEYQDKASVQKLIGSSDGRMAGNLTESVLQKPYSLILLDEFEKAYPDILNIFLQVFDDGRLTDNLGRTIDFANTIIIATSNAHSDFIKSHIDAHTPMDVIADELKKKLTDYFKPELLNRFSKIIVFKTLSLEDIEAIAKLQLIDLAKSMNEASATDLTFDKVVIKRVAELGFDPAFGGRPMRQVISEKLRSVLAEKILKEEIVKGSSVFVSVTDSGEFQFAQK